MARFESYSMVSVAETKNVSVANFIEIYLINCVLWIKQKKTRRTDGQINLSLFRK